MTNPQPGIEAGDGQTADGRYLPVPVSPAALTPVSAARRRLGGTSYTPASDTLTAAPAEDAPGGRSTGRRHRRRRRRRRWYQRPVLLVVLTLVLVIAAGASFVFYRAESTIGTLHSYSTPPPAVAIVPDEASGAPAGGAATSSTADDKPVTVDTGPARAAIAADPRNQGSEGFLQGVKGAAGNVGNLAGAAAMAAGIHDSSATAMNVLLMGVDARPGEPIDIAVRPDSLMVLHVNAATGTCRVLAIPRDTRTMLPGYGLSKVNQALMVGGIPYQRIVVEQLLGINIDHYALIDFTGFKEMVDAVGGISVNVPATFTASNMTFHAGPQTLNGAQALAYARYRGGPDSDLGRIRAQQQILHALLQKGAGRNVVNDVNSLLPAFAAHIRTDLSSTELVSLAQQYRSTCTAERLQLNEIRGTVNRFQDPLLHKSLYFLVPYPGEIKQRVTELVGA